MDSSTVSPKTSSTVGNNTAKLFFENVSMEPTRTQVNQWVTLSGLQFGRLSKRRDDSLQVENEVDGLATAIDGG
jgi:hypothetical protein